MKKRSLVIENGSNFLQNKKVNHELRKTTSNIENFQEIFPLSTKEQICEALDICEDIAEVSEYLLDEKTKKQENKPKKEREEKDSFKELINNLKLKENQLFDLILFLNNKENFKFIPKIEEYNPNLLIPKKIDTPKLSINNFDKPKKDVLPLEYGVMLFKNWMDESEQMGLYYLVKKIKFFFFVSWNFFFFIYRSALILPNNKNLQIFSK